MKLFHTVWIVSGVILIIGFFSETVYAAPGRGVARADFVKLVVSEKFSQAEIEACDKSHMPFRDVRLQSRTAPYLCVAYQRKWIRKSQKFRPAAKITLAEAAVILKNAFDLRGFSFDNRDRAPWYEPYLRALEEKNALPISFWTPNDLVTREEAREMILRLNQQDTTKPSMTFEALHTQRMPYRAQDILRLYGDFSKSLDAKVITPELVRLFEEPGTYFITDINAAEQDSMNYCHNFYTQSGVRGNVTVITNGGDVTMIIEALSGDYCVFPFPEMEPGGCPKDAVYADDPRCNRGQAKPYTLTLEKKENKLFVKGAESNRIRISRAPIEPICREFADGCPAGYYNHTKVETVGSLSTTMTPNGETWNVYKTRWQSLLSDLRGVPFLRVEKTLADGRYFSKYYEAPQHNKNAWGHGVASYEDCIADPVESSISLGYDFHFCIKRAGNDFVLASPYELGDRLTLWIDPHYRR